MKAILVIDMPDYVDFNKAKTVDIGLCFNVKEYTEPFIKSNVPLKPMPQRKYSHDSEMDIGYTLGWNNCLEEIEK